MKRQKQNQVLLVKVITQIARKRNAKNIQIDSKMILTANLRKTNSCLHNKYSGRVLKSVVKPKVPHFFKRTYCVRIRHLNKNLSKGPANV